MKMTRVFLRNLSYALELKENIPPSVESLPAQTADSGVSQEQATSPPTVVQGEQNTGEALPETISQPETPAITEKLKAAPQFELNLEKFAFLLFLSREGSHTGHNRRSSYVPNLQTAIAKHQREPRNFWTSVLSLLEGPAEIKDKIAVFKFKENTSLTYDMACAKTFRNDILTQAPTAEIVVFDFKNVKNLDTTITETLENFHRHLLKSNKHLVFIHVSDSIKEKVKYEILMCTSLSEVKPLVESYKIKKYKSNP